MSAMDYWKQCPPVTRTLAASTFIISLLVHTKLMSYYWIVFHPPLLMKWPPHIWSFFTSFMLTGPDFGILYDTYFLYTYGAKLERASPKFTQPGDFFSYVLFVGITALGLNYFITGAGVFTQALILAFVYTSSQDDRGQMATFYIITIPAQWMPYAMLVMGWVMAGTNSLLVGLTGLVAAHLHDFLTRIWPEIGGGSNLVPTPWFIRRIFETRQVTVTHKAYGTSFARAQREEEPSSGGDPLPNSWKSRGGGHRLGGS